MAERHRSERSHEQGIFAKMMAGLVAEHGQKKTVMIDVSRRTPCARVSLRNYLKAHRTASSLGVKKGGAVA
ncbi:hypothetical protein HCZ97_08465 [Pseudooceanicola sp. HF7]|nr:hypothetical protein [Pseudooceanicola sp. HF7]